MQNKCLCFVLGLGSTLFSKLRLDFVLFSLLFAKGNARSFAVIDICPFESLLNDTSPLLALGPGLSLKGFVAGFNGTSATPTVLGGRPGPETHTLAVESHLQEPQSMYLLHVSGVVKNRQLDAKVNGIIPNAHSTHSTNNLPTMGNEGGGALLITHQTSRRLVLLLAKGAYLNAFFFCDSMGQSSVFYYFLLHSVFLQRLNYTLRVTEGRLGQVNTFSSARGFRMSAATRQIPQSARDRGLSSFAPCPSYRIKEVQSL